MSEINIPEIEFRQANIHDVVDFLNKVGQPLDPGLKNLSAWFERMKARPSAAA